MSSSQVRGFAARSCRLLPAWLAWTAVGCWSPWYGAATLTDVPSVLRLSAVGAARGQPVRLQAVVLYNDRDARRLFVHDSKAGVFVEWAADVPHPSV